jgi:hypothetical protein
MDMWMLTSDTMRYLIFISLGQCRKPLLLLPIPGILTVIPREREGTNSQSGNLELGQFLSVLLESSWRVDESCQV